MDLGIRFDWKRKIKGVDKRLYSVFCYVRCHVFLLHFDLCHFDCSVFSFLWAYLQLTCGFRYLFGEEVDGTAFVLFGVMQEGQKKSLQSSLQKVVVSCLQVDWRSILYRHKQTSIWKTLKNVFCFTIFHSISTKFVNSHLQKRLMIFLFQAVKRNLQIQKIT